MSRLAEALHRLVNCERFLGCLRLDVAGDVQVVVVGGDFVQGEDAGDAFDILVAALRYQS